MHNTMLLLLFVLFVNGVSGAETVSVMEGDSVTLHTGLTEILNDHTIVWKFGPKGSFISEITRENNYTSFSVTDDVRFKGRLQVDQNTGSLTIRNTREKHSGQYQLTISRGKDTSKTFNVTVQRVVSGTDGVKSKSASVTEGDSVTLNPDKTQIQGDALMLWRFGDKGILLAKIDVETKETSLNNADERFTDRLQLDQTGSLTIRNTRTTDSGLYQLQTRGSESLQQFVLTVNQPGLSPGAIAGIVFGVLCVAAVAVAAGFIYFRRKMSELRKQTLPVTVREGEDVTLKPNKAIKKDDKILWMFGEGKQRTPIAELNGKPREIVPHDYAAGGIFRDRLYLDETTGSLTIKNSRIEHSGLYKLQITSSRGASEQRFILTVKVPVTVREGEDVTLKPNKAINNDDYILWQFGDEELQTGIAEIRTVPRQIVINDYDYVAGGRFRGRLYLDETTGSLTIKNSRIEHSGLYKLQITSSRGASEQRFILTVKENMEVISVEDGSVTLYPDTEIQRDDLMLWMFGDQDRLIAQIKGGTGEIYDAAAERFRGRLQLNKTTGSLTITDITPEHTGLYKLLTISSKGILCKKFKVFIPHKATGKQQNVGEAVYVNTPLLDKEVPDGVNDQEMSSV